MKSDHDRIQQSNDSDDVQYSDFAYFHLLERDKLWSSILFSVNGDIQQKSPDSVVDCVYGLAVNLANIIVILWTILTLYVMSDCQIWYCPCYDHDISHICG